MSRTKKVFLVFASLFFLILAILAYDISKRTMFPGSQKKSELEHNDEVTPSDTIKDSQNSE